MKPVAIFRHFPSEGPGYFAEFLDARNIPWQLIRIDAGDTVPDSAAQFSGLAFMGGPMSVNDPLPWIPPVLALIRDAVERDIPVLGHCLGGQLMSRALGGVVGRNPVKEIGWGEVSLSDCAEARLWFGEGKHAMAFHWHGETFSLPPGAVHLLASRYCANQAYAIGKHLALQCHVEMTEAMIDEWCAVGAQEIAENLHSAGVQAASVIKAQTPQHLAQLRGLAEHIYTRWVQGMVSK